MALWCRTPSAGLRHHADRGPQYASPAYQGMLAVHGMYCWRSGQSQCRDYAVAERFLSRFKQERTSLHEDAMRQEPQDNILDAIELFYNSMRLHASLGDVSPNNAERCARAGSRCVRLSLTAIGNAELTRSNRNPRIGNARLN